MSHEETAPPIHPRVRMRMNILWPLEGPREQPRVSCRSVHMCESNEWLLPAQMAGRTCAVVGSSAQHGFESKQTHLVGLRRLRWPSSQRHVLEMCCTWRKKYSRRGSRTGARRKKIRRQLREASSAASSRAATSSHSFHAAPLGRHRAFRRRFTGGGGGS